MNYDNNKKTLYANVDEKLKNSAVSANILLGEDFHDRAKLSGSISKDEDMSNILKLSTLSKDIEVEYVYSLIQKEDGEMYFTSASATQDEIDNNKVTRYFDPYDEASSGLKSVLKNNKIVYEKITDRWGTFRSAFIPFTAKNGSSYIVCADMRIDYIEETLYTQIKSSIIMQLVILFILSILSFYFLRITKKEILIIQHIEQQLHDEIEERTEELSQLNSSLEHKIKEALAQNTKQLEALQQQSKLASMGEMIGAIAHQWRQPLNEIGISIQNTKYDFRNGEIDEKYIKEFIDENRKVIEFMSKTIDDFRGFFRVDKEKKDFNVKEAIEKVVSMLSAQLKDHQISLDISGDDFDIVNLESEFQQVILNIISNAKDALVENNIQNPKIEIALKDNSVYIKDNGGGVPRDIIERIFEPYYTTKEQGKGTGMGLYMSKMIIEDNMGGSLHVENDECGAVFTIELRGKVL